MSPLFFYGSTYRLCLSRGKLVRLLRMRLSIRMYPIVIVWLIIKAAGKHFRLLSREDAGMAVYCDQGIHATNIRGGSVFAIHRDDDIGIPRRTTIIPLRDKVQFSKDCLAAAVSWQKNYDCRLVKKELTAAIEECNVCNNDEPQTRIRCSSSEFKVRSSCLHRNHNADITMHNTNKACVYKSRLGYLFPIACHIGLFM